VGDGGAEVVRLSASTRYRDHLRRIYWLSSGLSLLEWDQEAVLGEKGMASRSQAIGTLAREVFDLSVAPQFGEWLQALEGDPHLTEAEAASVRWHKRRFDRRQAVPPERVEEHACERSRAQAAWAEARRKADFRVFLPHLERMVAFARRFADLYGYDRHPYDALLEEYEPGMTVDRLHPIMGSVRESLVNLLGRLSPPTRTVDDSIMRGSFDVDRQRALARCVLRAIGYDFAAGALHDVEHPFTTAIAFGDVRVTNQYDEAFLPYGLFGALHEGGHALYHQGMPEELYELGLQEGSSAGGALRARAPRGILRRGG
jgi:carboxypeptidase Taq